MLERMILEIKDKHSKRPISQDQFNRWRSSAVTQRLFEDLEMAVIDSFQDYLSNNCTPEQILNYTGLRDGAAQMVERVLDWAPAGVEGVNDED